MLLMIGGVNAAIHLLAVLHLHTFHKVFEIAVETLVGQLQCAHIRPDDSRERAEINACHPSNKLFSNNSYKGLLFFFSLRPPPTPPPPPAVTRTRFVFWDMSPLFPLQSSVPESKGTAFLAFN